MTEFINRALSLASFLVPGKALIISGPRRAGKTTLLKSSANRRVKPPLKWSESYPGATYELVTPENYLEFVGE